MPPEKGEAMLPEYDRSGMTGAKKQLLKENPKVGPRHEARARRDAGCRKRWPADLPIVEQIIDPKERGIAAPGLLAQIIVRKYCHPLPLYRQEAILENRHGVHLPRQNMARWMGLATDWLRPIYEHIRTGVMAGGYLQIDETPIP